MSNANLLSRSEPPQASEPRQHDTERYKVMAAGLCALVLSLGIARFAYTPLLPVMQQQAGLSPLVAGWLATFIYLGYTAGTLLATFTKDPHRKFYLYRLCLILAVLSTLAMGLSNDPLVWYISRLIGGFSGIAGLLLASGLALNWLIRTGHKPQLGLHFTGAGLGIVVTGVCTGLMLEQLSWDQQWLLLGIVGVLFLVPAWIWMPAPASLASQPSMDNPAFNATSKRWMVLMMLAYFCGGCGYVMGATFIVDILERLPLLNGAGPWCWVIVGLAAAPSTFLWDKVAVAIGQIRALILAYVLQAFSMLLPAISDWVVLNLLAAVLWGGTFIGIVNLTLTLVGRRFPHNPASYMAAVTLGYSVSQMVAPAITGYVLSMTGEYRLALLVSTLVMFAGVAVLWLIQQLPEQPVNPVADPTSD